MGTIVPAAVEPAFDNRPARWRVGLITLATDHTTERDFARMRPTDEIAVYVSRVQSTNPTTAENLRRMAPRLTEAAALILPGETLDAVAYGCTSATVEIGFEEIAARIHVVRPHTPCVTPATAALAAFENLNVCRVAVLTPYTREVSESIERYFVQHGAKVVSLNYFDLDDDRVMARIRPDCIVEAATAADHPQAEALFISCTALRAAQVAERIEERLGKPVITSNQAMFWQSLRTAGYDEPISGYGRLLQN